MSFFCSLSLEEICGGVVAELNKMHLDANTQNMKVKRMKRTKMKKETKRFMIRIRI
jgi:hypothetical protein